MNLSISSIACIFLVVCTSAQATSISSCPAVHTSDDLKLPANTCALLASQESTPSPPTPSMSAIRRSAPLTFPAPGKHTATVIFAHGLGDTGHGWASAVENWRRRQRLDEVKFVLPHAPAVPITAVSLRLDSRKKSCG